jgi:hypothetical protein
MAYIKNEYVVVSTQGVPKRTTKLKNCMKLCIFWTVANSGLKLLVHPKKHNFDDFLFYFFNKL